MYNPNNPIKMIYKLSYTDKATAVADLKAKGILVESTFQEETSLVYGEGVQAVVEIGLIVIDSTVDPPIYADGYHYDVMAIEVYDFGTNLVVPKNPKHAFMGYAITDEVEPILVD
jgi:hypothetical protein